MGRGMPSMVALLGLLAVAGYQNREKLAELLSGLGESGGKAGQPGGRGQPKGLGGVLEGLGGLLGGSSAGSVLSGGLGDLFDRFKESGQGAAAESWIRKGPNQPIAPDALERALGHEIVDKLMQQTGLARDELLARLARTLPEAVDRYTPDGRIPTAEEAVRS